MELVEVELDDAPPAPPQPRRRRPWSLRAWGQFAVLVAVLAAAATVAQGVQGVHLAPPGPGLVLDLTAARHELWRTEASSVLGVVDDVLIATTDDGRVLGLDWDTGDLLWWTEANGCALADADARGVLPDTSARHDGRTTRVVCRSWRATSAAVVVEVLDPRDGARVIVAELGSDAVLVWSVGDVLLVADGTLTARSLLTGEVLWARDIEDPVLDVTGGEGHLSIITDDATSGLAYLAVDARTGADLDVADGVVVDELAVPGGVLEVRATGSGPVTALRGFDGGVRWEIPGTLWRPLGAAMTGGVVAIRSFQLEVVEVATGEPVWQSTLPLLGVEGVFVQVEWTDDSAISVRDAGTGAELWSVPFSMMQTGVSALSDGRHLAAAEAVDGGQRLVVRDLLTGKVATSWPLPGEGLSEVLALPDGRVAQLAGLTDPLSSTYLGSPTLVVLG